MRQAKQIKPEKSQSEGLWEELTDKDVESVTGGGWGRSFARAAETWFREFIKPSGGGKIEKKNESGGGKRG